MRQESGTIIINKVNIGYIIRCNLDHVIKYIEFIIHSENFVGFKNFKTVKTIIYNNINEYNDIKILEKSWENMQDDIYKIGIKFIELNAIKTTLADKI